MIIINFVRDFNYLTTPQDLIKPFIDRHTPLDPRPLGRDRGELYKIN